MHENWNTGPVCLDELVTVLAQYPTDQTWNGWLLPHMDPVAVETVFAAFADLHEDQPSPTHTWDDDGNLLVTEYDGDTGYTETLPPDADGLYSPGAFGWVWAEDTAAQARMDLSQLVADLGGGFHPDTPGADYTSLPDGWTPERVDEVVNTALEVLGDDEGYWLAFDVLGLNPDTDHAPDPVTDDDPHCWCGAPAEYVSPAEPGLFDSNTHLLNGDPGYFVCWMHLHSDYGQPIGRNTK